MHETEEYKQRIGEFEENVKFYIVGSNTFLIRNRVGDDETMYIHVLHFDMNRFTVTTFERYRLGLGVCSMHGYKRWNKESKNEIRRFNKNSDNLVAASL